MDDLDFGATIKGFSPGQKVFNRYTLQKILGRGGMGVVWLAHDGELERDIALKFLPELVAMDKEAVRDLKRETRRSLELTHPNIVRIYDFLNDARTAAISMEYVAGATLASLKVDRPAGCFEVADLRDWTRQVCDALEYAHGRAKVVHRDLKPANLMIDGQGYLKVTDFGIAASTSDSVSRVSAQAGSSGTPLYMSPQQMLGEKPAVTDDIYALGATLFELLTGKPPFHAGNVLLQVQSKVPPTLAERRQELEVAGAPIPVEWEATIAACLAKTPGGRPQSALELSQRLGLAGSSPAQARSNPPAGAAVAVTRGAVIAGKPTARQAKIFSALVLGAVVLGVAAAGYWRHRVRQAAEAVQLAERAAVVEAEKLAARKTAEAFTAWAGEISTDNVFLTPHNYSPEALTRIYEGVKLGAARRLARGNYAGSGQAPGEADQPKPADLVEFLQRPRAIQQEVTSLEAPEGYLEAIGWWIAQDRFFPEVEFTEEEWSFFLSGLERRLTGGPLLRLGDEDQMNFNEMIEPRRQDYARKARSARAAQFFAWLDTQPNVSRTASGLRYTIDQQGTGERPSDSKVIRCRFSIRDVDGEFLGTETTTEAFDLRPGDVMPGMREGLQLVRVGGKIQLYIPAALTRIGQLKRYPNPDKSINVDIPHDMDLKVEAEVLAVLPP